MKFIILCPENLCTGGTELAHQLCDAINKDGLDAYMYYINIKTGDDRPVDVDTPDKFKKYCDKHIRDYSEVNMSEDVFVVPEALTDWAFSFREGKVCIWWMSVDNFRHKDDQRYIRLLDYVSVYHLIQSEYAADFLRKKGINEDKLVWLSDYISDTYLSIQSSPENKKNAILYNPQKGYENIEPLIEKIKYAEWIPLKNLSEAEMIEKMKAAKIYIDFGKHPGKDRIPRETAICGCCVITNKCGSAAFEGDVPIGEEYKFENQKDIDAIEKMIRSIFDEYLIHYEKFESYRDFIRQEKEYFMIDAKGFTNLFIK